MPINPLLVTVALLGPDLFVHTVQFMLVIGCPLLLLHCGLAFSSLEEGNIVKSKFALLHLRRRKIMFIQTMFVFDKTKRWIFDDAYE